MAVTTVDFEAVLDTSKYDKAVKGLDSKTKSAWTNAQGASTGLLTGVTVAAAGVVALGVTSVGAAEEAESANKRLDQIYSQMGDSTGKLSKAAQKYADDLSKQIGVDDEIIKGAQAKLATFSKVSGSADTMARATKAAADLSAAGFGDMSSTSVQLGKALQDPEKGITALSRSGVTFTEDEKKMIKAMADAGDTAGYQEVMLAAVEKQVGGVSEATATTSDKISVYGGEIQESLGKAFKPIAEAILPAISDMADKLAEFFESDWQGKLKELAPVFAIVAGAILAGMVPALWAMAGAAVAAITPLLPFIAIGALIGGAIYLIIQAMGGWESAWKTIQDTFSAVWSFLQPAIEAVKKFIGDTFNYIASWVMSNMGLIKATITTVMGVIKNVWTAVWNVIKAVVPPIWNVIKTAISTAIKTVLGVIKAVMQIIQGDWKGAWETIVNTVKNLVGGLGKIAQNIGKAIWDGLKAGLSGIGKLLLDTLKGAAETAWKGFKSVFGIKSPSKKMRWAIEMIAKGADLGMPAVEKSLGSLADLTQGILPSMQPSASSRVVNYTQNIYTPVTSYAEAKRAQLDANVALAGGLV